MSPEADAPKPEKAETRAPKPEKAEATGPKPDKAEAKAQKPDKGEGKAPKGEPKPGKSKAPAEAAAEKPKPAPPPRPPADPRLKLLKKFHGKFLPRGPLRDRHKALMARWNSGDDHGGVTVDELRALFNDWKAGRKKHAPSAHA